MLCAWTIPKRYVIALMILISNVNLIVVQMNLVVALTGITTPNNTFDVNGSVEQKGAFDWNSKEKGIVLSTSSYGSLLSPVAGLMAAKIGGSTICSIANLIIALITFATPFIYENCSLTMFVIVYTILGIFEVFGTPVLVLGLPSGGIPQLLSRWVPPNERSRFSAINSMGISFGAIISFVTSGWIIQNWGKDVLFYSSGEFPRTRVLDGKLPSWLFTFCTLRQKPFNENTPPGIISFMWFWIWLLLVKNDPSEDSWMSKTEQRYIRKKLSNRSTVKNLEYPWMSILTCVSFWCGCLSNFTIVFSNTFISVCLPQFMRDTYNMDIETIGYVSTLPQISTIISISICGILFDYVRSKDTLSKQNMHKLSNAISLFTGFATFLVMALEPSFTCNLMAAVVFTFFSAFALIDVTVLLLDLTTKYAALLESAANMWASVAASVAPVVIGFVVTSYDLSQWNICFYGLSILNLSVGMIYLAFFPSKEYSLDEILE